MNSIESLRSGHKRFHRRYFVENSDLYETLIKDGQSPKTLVVSCSDSRTDPAIFLDSKPGELFVIRNVASLVPPYQSDKSTYHGTSAALEFGVCCLNVENIVVIGHSYCAGINALLTNAAEETEYIKEWVDIAFHAKKKAHQHSDPLGCCVRESVHISVQNLCTFPWIKTRVESNKLSVYGWYFNMDTGLLEDII